MVANLLLEQSWKAILFRQPDVQRRTAMIRPHTVARRASGPTRAQAREMSLLAVSSVMERKHSSHPST